MEKNLTALECLSGLDGFEESLKENIYICLYWEAVCDKALAYAFYLSENSNDVVKLKEISKSLADVRKKLMNSFGNKRIYIPFERC